MITPADSAPVPPGQMPQYGSPGSAPVPYAGASQRPEPPLYVAPSGAGYGPDGAIAEVLSFPGAALTVPSPAWPATADAPYYAAQLSPIVTMGDADAGGRDDVAGSVAGSVAAAEARFLEHQGDTYQQGSRIGDPLPFPPNPLDPGVGSLGLTDPEGAYYDPARIY